MALSSSDQSLHWTRGGSRSCCFSMTSPVRSSTSNP